MGEKGKPKVGRPKRGPRHAGPSSTANAFLAVLSVFVLLLGGVGVAMDRAELNATTASDEITPDQAAGIAYSSIETELFFLSVDAVSEVENASIVPANVLLDGSVKKLFDERYDPMKVGGYRIYVRSYELDIAFMTMSVVASTCTGNISISGTVAPYAAPAYYRLTGHVAFDISDAKGPRASANVTIDRLIPDISPYIETRLTELDRNGQTEFTDIGRLVRYMLTTLVRYRAYLGIGSGPYDTEKDLLNEGDVELAVNLAVLLEEARLFGTYDEDAVDAIDHYFYSATDPEQHKGEVAWEPYNPTGMRPWGSAEKKNYARYQNKMPRGEDRTLRTLFEGYVKQGVVDPADLFALYLNVDQYEREKGIDPLDGASFLFEHTLFDGRYPFDRRDPDHLVYMANIGPRELVLRDPTGTFGLDYKERLAVDHSPDYLTVGSDIAVSKNITVPYKYMTNTRLTEGSRTGGVPPPQPPPDHDWIMLWEFRITGSFEISVGRDNAGSQEDGTSRQWLVTREISIDVPIGIFTSLKIRPMNSAMTFTNLNTGSPPGATYNFTYESIAYEHFSNGTWSMLKDVYSAALGDAIRIVKGAACPYTMAMDRGSDLAVLSAYRSLQDVPADVWVAIDEFVTKRITGPNLSTVILRPFINSEYFIDIDLIKGIPGKELYTLRLGVQTNVGLMTLDMVVTEGSPVTKGRISVDMDLTVDGVRSTEVVPHRGQEISYSLVWDAAYKSLRPTGSGIMDGSWSFVEAAPGPSTLKAIQVELGGGMTMRAFQIREGSEPDRTTDLMGAVPVGLSQDPTVSMALVSSALKGNDVNSMMLLLATDPKSDEWFGLKATGEADVALMLDWVAAHSEILVLLAKAGRLGGSTIGMAAAVELGDRGNIEGAVMLGDVLFKAPLPYYADASQMFDPETKYGPLRADVMDVTQITTSSSSKDRVDYVVIDYYLDYEILLTDPWVMYGVVPID